MARIRTIKPEFFTSEDIVGLSAFARLLYIAIWCEADKEGRLLWKPKTLKMRYFPADDIDINYVAAEILDAGLVCLYGNGMAYIPTFARHQHVNPRESASALPAPDGLADQGPRKVGKTVRQAVFDRDGHQCVRCGSTDKIQVDHILPQSLGGPHVIENLRTLCRACNAGRPVCGDALDNDLAIDGLTLEVLRVKFGIDASIPEMTHREEGKGREGKESSSKTHAHAREAVEFQPIPDTINPTAWADWEHHRKKRRKPISDRAAREQWSLLSSLTHDQQAECIAASIRNDWQGLFPEKFTQPRASPANGTRGRSITEDLTDRSWAQ